MISTDTLHIATDTLHIAYRYFLISTDPLHPKFRQLPDVSEDMEKEWLLFRSALISSAAESCGRKRLRVAGDSEKRTPWRNQEVKEAFRAKKDAFKAWLQDRSSSDL